MMLQAASRQSTASHNHQQQQPHATARAHHRQPLQQRQRRSGCPPASAKSAQATAVSADEDANLRSGRFASALLFMAVLVLMVDASRIILYSWYTDGSYLKYLYGSEAEIRWPKCDGALDSGVDFVGGAGAEQPTTTPASSVAVVITAMSRQHQRQQRQQQQQQQEQQLDQFKDSLMGCLTLAGRLLDSAVGDASSPAPRRVAKPLVRVLFHASTVACLFFLAVAIFPAALRTHQGRCLLLCSLLFSLTTVAVAGASAAASMLSVYFFSACELQPRVRRVYDFVPDCDALRRAFLGAECFSLIVVCSSVCLLLHLMAYFCRALCATCGCCRPGGGGGDGDDCDDGGGDGLGNDFELARPCRRTVGAGRPYDEEEYLA